MAENDKSLAQPTSECQNKFTKLKRLRTEDELMKEFFATHSYDKPIDWRAAPFDESED